MAHTTFRQFLQVPSSLLLPWVPNCPLFKMDSPSPGLSPIFSNLQLFYFYLFIYQFPPRLHEEIFSYFTYFLYFLLKLLSVVKVLHKNSEQSLEKLLIHLELIVLLDLSIH
jgi:hypothetical protein